MNAMTSYEMRPEELLHTTKRMMRVFDNLEDTEKFKMSGYMHPVVSRPLWVYATRTKGARPKDVRTDEKLKKELGEQGFEQIEQIRRT